MGELLGEPFTQLFTQCMGECFTQLFGEPFTQLFTQCMGECFTQLFTQCIPQCLGELSGFVGICEKNAEKLGITTLGLWRSGLDSLLGGWVLGPGVFLPGGLASDFELRVFVLA